MQVTKYLSHKLGIWEQENQSKTAQIMNILVHFIRGTIKTTSTALLSEESCYQKLKGMKHYAVADDHSLLTNDNIINYHYYHYYIIIIIIIIIRHLFSNLMLGSTDIFISMKVKVIKVDGYCCQPPQLT